MSEIAPLSLLSSVVVLDSSLEGWSLLDSGTEDHRVARLHVSFDRPFSGPPIVQVGIVGLDVSNHDNLRVRVAATDITPEGFWLEARTWWNTKIWSVDVSWLAIGS